MRPWIHGSSFKSKVTAGAQAHLDSGAAPVDRNILKHIYIIIAMSPKNLETLGFENDPDVQHVLAVILVHFRRESVRIAINQWNDASVLCTTHNFLETYRYDCHGLDT